MIYCPNYRRKAVKIPSSVPDHVSLRWYMRGANSDRWLDLKIALPNSVCRHMHNQAFNKRGVVLGVYVRSGASVSASQLEFYRRDFVDRFPHRRGVLHRNMGHLRGQGEAAQRVVRSSEERHRNRKNFRCSERAWDHCFRFQRT